MLDEILLGLFGEAAFGRIGNSRRAQLLARLFFGVLGAGLGIVGAMVFAGRPDVGGNAAMRLSMIAMFVCLASFSLFNIGLGRTWRWPGKLFVVSCAALILSRLLLGA